MTRVYVKVNFNFIQGCRYHTQCPGQAICVLRVCIAAEPSGGVCQRQNDCKVGRACKHGICWQPAESPNVVAQCTAHEDCKSQTVCKNNTCVASSPIDRDCNKHSDCPMGDACKFGVCWRAITLSKDVECVITEDCVGRTLCDRRGSCRPARPTSVACDTDDNCGLLERCKHSMCWRYIIGECQRNEDCTGQRLCHQGRCVTSKPMDRYCNTDDDCGTNSSSSNRGRCKYGLCWSFNGKSLNSLNCAFFFFKINKSNITSLLHVCTFCELLCCAVVYWKCYNNNNNNIFKNIVSERMKQHAEREELMDVSDEDAQQLLD